MKCEHCGYDAPEQAVICPECGEIMPRRSKASSQKSETEANMPENFSMPFLRGVPEELSEESETMEDPIEKKRQQQEHHRKVIRCSIAIGAVVVIALAVILYHVFLGGYKLAVFRYVKGVDYSSGSLYTALVPDAYMDYLEDTYDTTKREVKEMVGDYFVSYNKNYVNSDSLSYRIDATTVLNEEEVSDVESELKSSYGISVEIKEAVKVKLIIDDGGEKGTESSVFVKIGHRWCSVKAMEDIDYICQYDGYGAW